MHEPAKSTFIRILGKKKFFPKKKKKEKIMLSTNLADLGSAVQ
jgi:hypothetical protein